MNFKPTHEDLQQAMTDNPDMTQLLIHVLRDRGMWTQPETELSQDDIAAISNIAMGAWRQVDHPRFVIGCHAHDTDIDTGERE